MALFIKNLLSSKLNGNSSLQMQSLKNFGAKSQCLLSSVHSNITHAILSAADNVHLMICKYNTSSVSKAPVWKIYITCLIRRGLSFLTFVPKIQSNFLYVGIIKGHLQVGYWNFFMQI